MVFGWLPKNVAYYSLGVFTATGLGFRNQDNWPAFVGRAFIARWPPSRAPPQLAQIDLGGGLVSGIQESDQPRGVATPFRHWRHAERYDVHDDAGSFGFFLV